jgi:uncharacterized delta-60 repeat protein
MSLAFKSYGKIVFVIIVTLFCAYAADYPVLSPEIIDPSYKPEVLTNQEPWAVALQPDGKLIISCFKRGVAWAENRTYRLNADGSFDSSFTSDIGQFSRTRVMTVQPDGKILLGGYLWPRTGEPRSLARLNSNGSLDTSFQSSVIKTNSTILRILPRPDGKVLVGYYESIEGVGAVYRTVRLHGDGSRDTSFAELPSCPYMLFDKDGKLLIAGNPVKRLLSDGSVDPSFASQLVFEGPDWMGLQPNGKIIIARNIIVAAPPLLRRAWIARLNADGTADESFAIVHKVNHYTFSSIAVQADGSVIFVGTGWSPFTDWVTAFERYRENGTPDTSYLISPSGSTPSQIGPGGIILLQDSYRALVVGNFGFLNGVARPGVARIFTERLPKLLSASDEGRLRLSWPTNSVQYSLESAQALSGSNWIQYSATPVVSNDTHTVLIERTNEVHFFRLKKE